MNRFICGDCNEVLRRDILDETIDLSVFSPPYDLIRNYHGFAFDYHTLGKEIYRVTKDGGVCVCVIGDGTKDFAKSMTSMRLAVDWVDNVGWKMFETCIYSRFGRPGAWWNQRLRVDHELILMLFKGKRPKYFNKEHLKVPAKHAGETWHGTTRLTDGSLVKNEPKVCANMKCRGTIWKFSTSNTEGNKTKLLHPATFPNDLASDLIRCFSKEGDLVLDPTCGSGTTCIEAAKWKRKWLGIDISKEYIELCNLRMQNEVKDHIL